MDILNKKILDFFIKKHADTKSAAQSWLAEASSAKWKNTSDIKGRYPSASFLADNRVIFNLKGNSYRLEVKVAFKGQKLIIEWIGTHAEYDRRYK